MILLVVVKFSPLLSREMLDTLMRMLHTFVLRVMGVLSSRKNTGSSRSGSGCLIMIRVLFRGRTALGCFEMWFERIGEDDHCMS